MNPTRLTSIRAQLLFGFSLILGLALMLAVIGYFSLRNVQQVIAVNLEQANEARDRSLKIETQFLLARQNETAFLEQWREVGLETAVAQYANANQGQINAVRQELILLRQLADADPDLLSDVNAELDALESLLNYYAQTFENSLAHVQEQGRTEGLERSLIETFAVVEQGVVHSPDPRFYQLALRIYANEQAYFNTGHEEYVDRVRLLTNELIQLLSDEGDQLQTDTPTFQVLTRLQAHQVIFLRLVSSQRNLAANQSVFREITEDVNQAIAAINASGERSLAEARQQLATTNWQSNVALLVTAVIALGVSLITARALSQRIITPLAELNQTAQAIGAGTHTKEVAIGGSQEMAALGVAFNQMNRRLNELIGSLEQRVANRTRDLALAGEVSRSLGAIRDVDELLNKAAQIIQHQFDLYQVQVYLTDKASRNLILRAGTGQATAALLSQGHRLPIGPGSINGVAAADKRSVLVSDTANNALFRPNPLLPDTRSELATPLIAAQEVVGVLDLQSATPGAFTEENLTAFELLAGQLATAIENAHLFAEINRAQEAIAAQTRLLTRTGWREFRDAIEQPEFIGYSYDQSTIQQLTAPSERATPGGATSGAVPILIAGEPVGRLEVDGPDAADTELLTAVANQVARQIENLRLLTQAERYRVAAEEVQARLRREGWEAFRETARLPEGYLYDQNEVQPLSADNALSVDNGRPQPRLTRSIAIQGELIGEIGVLDERPIGKEDEQLLTAVAERLANHLESLRLVSQTEQALAETAFLYQASAQLNRAANYRDILDVIQHYTVAGNDANNIGLALFDSDWTEDNQPTSFRYMASWSLDPQLRLGGHYWLKDFPTAGQILQKKEPTFVKDIYTDDRFDANLRQIYGQRLKAQSVLFAPLVVANRWSGFINAIYAQPMAFTETQLRQLTLIGGQAAVAIQNLRSLDLSERRAREALQRSEELSTLNRIVSQLTASFNLYELLEVVAQELIALFDLEHVGIALMDESKESLTVVADTARQPGSESAVGIVLPVKGNLSTERVIATQKSLVITDAPHSPLTEPIHEMLRWRGTETLIIMPLIASGQVIGTIGMDIATKDRVFTDEEMRLAETVVAQISSNVQNIHLFEQTERALAQTEILYKIGAELNAAQSYGDVLATVRRSGAIGERAHYLSLALFDRPWAGTQAPQKALEVARWASNQGQDTEGASQRSTGETPLPDAFWETGQFLFIEDLTGDARLPDTLRHRYQTEYGAASLLVEPLLIGNERIGYLLAFYPEEQAFTNTERQQFNAVIGQAAIALQNLRNVELAQLRAAQVEWLATIQSSLSQATNEEEILTAISLFADLDQPPDAMTLEYIHLSEAHEPERLELMARWRDGVIQTDEPLLGQRRHINESALSRLWLTAETDILRLEDVSTDPRMAEETRQRAVELGIGSLALMPLKSGNTWHGAITITWQQPHKFSTDERFYLLQMLDPATAVVAERRAYLAQQEALAETELLYQATVEFNQALTYDDILAALRRHTIVGADNGNAGLGLFNQPWTAENPAEWVDAVAIWSADDQANTPRRFLVSEYPSAERFLHPDKPVFIEDLDEADLDSKARALFKRVFRGRSAFFVPLLAGGQWIGYISVFYPQPRSFSRRERRQLLSMTNQAAVAVQNARLIEETRLRAEELLVLNEMGRDLTLIQEVENVLDTVHRHISRLMEASDSFIALYDEKTDEVNFRIYGQGENATPASLRRRAGQGITEYVIRSKKPLLIRENIRETAEKLGITLVGRDSASWLGVPMFVGTRVTGVLTVQSFTKPRLYDKHHQDLLIAFAGQTAIAIENIRLLQETRRRASELTVLNEMGRDLAETLDIATIVESAYQYCSQLMDTTNFFIALYEPEKNWVQFPLATENGRRVPWGGRVMGEGLTEYIIRQRRSLVVGENVSQWLDDHGIANIGTPAQSWIGVPMLFGEEVLGIIALQSFDMPHQFNEHHLELLNAIASQAASALVNARLFQQVQARARREELLRQITAEVRRSIDVETIMRTAVQEVGQALGRRAFIYLGDDQQPVPDEEAQDE